MDSQPNVAMVPTASVVVNSNVVGRQVDHFLVERRKGSPTLSTGRVVRIDPETALMTVKVGVYVGSGR